MRGVLGAMADSVDLVPDPRERRMPMPATPAHSLGVLLLLLPLCCVNTPFVAFPVDSCHTRSCCRAAWNLKCKCDAGTRYQCQFQCQCLLEYGEAKALKKCSTFGSQNNQNILYVAFSVPYSTSAAKAHELCAKNAAHVVTVSVVFASCRISPCSPVCPPSSPPLVTAVNLSVSHYATAS